MHLLTQSALLRALGWSLLNSLWQMAFLWLVYVFFTRIFKRTSANLRHGLAVFLLAAGTIWTFVSFFNTFLSADDPVQSYLPGIFYFSQTYWGSFIPAGRRLINESIPYCSTLYLLTLLFLSVRYARQYLFSKKLMQKGLSKPAPELRVFAAQTGRGMGIKREVSVWLSSLVEGPVTLGSLKPIILIPLATVSNLTPHQVEALILHELAHIRRHDYLLHLGIAALEILFFFNPFSKQLIRSIQKEREHRCDDLVLQFQYDPRTYVSALLTLARGMQHSPRLVLAATGCNDRLLLQRVRRILKLKTPPEPLRGSSLIFVFLTLLMSGMLLWRPSFSVSRTAGSPLTESTVPKSDATDNADITETKMVSYISVNLPIKNNPAPPPVKKAVRSHVHDADASDDDISGNEDQDVIQASDQSDDKETGDLAGYAAVVRVEKRDYSIDAMPAAKADAPQPASDCILQIPAPYVPNSSFSCQDIQDSTMLPGEQFVYLQQMATRQVELAINQMKKELQIQLKLLEHAGAQERPELKQKRQILLEQLKLQQQYLEKQQQLQRKLEKVGKKKVIVVI